MFCCALSVMTCHSRVVAGVRCSISFQACHRIIVRGGSRCFLSLFISLFHCSCSFYVVFSFFSLPFSFLKVFAFLLSYRGYDMIDKLLKDSSGGMIFITPLRGDRQVPNFPISYHATGYRHVEHEHLLGPNFVMGGRVRVS